MPSIHNAKAEPSISVIIPTYQREQVLLDTLTLVAAQLRSGDEILVVDQTPFHHTAIQQGLEEMAKRGTIKWFRKSKPSQCAAMNAAAHLSHGDVLLFLDDDIIPSPILLQAHREALNTEDPPPATCGQVLQPWDSTPVEQVKDFQLHFNAAYNHSCDILSIMAGNFAMRRETYFEVGGMDENFRGSNYRNDAEIAHRIFSRTGRKVRFVPEASLRHLYSSGGNRSFGEKDTWGHIGGSIGDYYFGIRWLRPASAVKHSVKRLIRAPLNRNTIHHPWLIPPLILREFLALGIALLRLCLSRQNYIKDLAAYNDIEPSGGHT